MITASRTRTRTHLPTSIRRLTLAATLAASVLTALATQAHAAPNPGSGTLAASLNPEFPPINPHVLSGLTVARDR